MSNRVRWTGGARLATPRRTSATCRVDCRGRAGAKGSRVRTTWADNRDRRGAIAVAIVSREAERVRNGSGKGQRGVYIPLDPGINSNLPQTFPASHSAPPIGSYWAGRMPAQPVRHDAAEPARQPPGRLGCPRSTARQWRPVAAAARAPPPVDSAIMTAGTRSTSPG